MPSHCMLSIPVYRKVASESPLISKLHIYRKEIDDIVYQIDAALIIVKEGEVNIGGNPSAEEQEEALENGAQQVNNVVHSHRLQKTVFDKKSYLTHLKVSLQPHIYFPWELIVVR